MLKPYPEQATRPAPAELRAKPAAERVKDEGYRGYVGGFDPESWYGIGKLQYHFLVANGLRHDHRFLDVACGSLRLGQYLIPFLDKGRYRGIEGEQSLVEAGLEQELLCGIAAIKQPKFAFNYQFDLAGLGHFDYAIAQSLFTHLTPEDIRRCFTGLAPHAGPGARFYATYFEGDPAANPKSQSHAQTAWRYRISDLADLGRSSGWKVRPIGDWGHPRKQLMALCERPQPQTSA